METLWTPAAVKPRARPRRLRRSAQLREALGETTLRTAQLVHPLFVRDGSGGDWPIASMPGHAQLTVDRLDAELGEIDALGIRSVLLFGIPDAKDASGSGAWNPSGPVPRAIAAIKRRSPSLVVIADVCLCEYTSHGHCGLLDDETGAVSNDSTLALLAQAAAAYGNAAAQMGMLGRGALGMMGYGAIASGIGPGMAALCAWSDGNKYPCKVVQVGGGQVLVAFGDGRQMWVPENAVSKQ